MTAKELQINTKLFSNRLNTAIAERELTQKEAAEKCNISKTSFWKYLHGQIPSTEKLFNIAKNLNISVDWLLGLKNN